MLDQFFNLHCPDCGGKIKDNERYCPHCGVDLEAPATPDDLKDDADGEGTAQEYFDSAQIDYDLDRNLDEALVNCEFAIQLDPAFAEAHNLRGLILDEKGKTQDAIASYREALRLNPAFEDARSNLRDAEAEQIKNGPTIPQAIELVEDSDLQSGRFTKYIAVAFILIIVIIASIFGFKYIDRFATAYLVSKSTIVFIPDVPEGMVVEKDDLVNTAQILTDRCERLGYSYISFEVSDAGEIIGKIPSTLDASAFAQKISAIGLLEFVDFGQTLVPGGTTIRTDLENKYLPQVEGQEWHTIMSNEGIMTAAALKSQIYETYEVDFVLTEKGTNIFFEHTTQNVGSYLGVVLDKSVISAPIIHQAIPGGEGVISGNFTQGTAEELAAVLQTKPLPFPIRLK